jgi:hypothetical protein
MFEAFIESECNMRTLLISLKSPFLNPQLFPIFIKQSGAKPIGTISKIKEDVDSLDQNKATKTTINNEIINEIRCNGHFLGCFLDVVL